MLNATCEKVFDDLADRYDALIDWPKRLALEGPFFRQLFESHAVHRVADVGCGTGRHAAMFHAWGLDVEGSDISSAMLNRCRELHGEDERLRWVQRSFLDSSPRQEPLDAVVCIGNSLALAGDMSCIERAVRTQVGRARPCGIGVIQVFNLWSIEEGPTQWQKVQRLDSEQHPMALVKGIHRVGNRGFIEIVETGLPESGVSFRAKSVSFVGIEVKALEIFLKNAGAEIVNVYGSYGGEPFDQEKSNDMIVVWWRPLCG